MSFWTTDEIAILDAHYPSGGVNACRPLLPERSDTAIHMAAHRRGLHMTGRRRPKPVPSSPHIDAAIKAAYASGEKGVIKALAKRLCRPYGWIRYRAGVLGCRPTRLKDPLWSTAEIAILERHAGQSLVHIQRCLKRSGFQRSLSAIQSRLYKHGIDTTDPDSWTANQVAALMGVDSHVVGRWIAKGWLKAKKIPARMNLKPASTPQNYRITRQRLRDFVRDNPDQIDLRKVDRFFFIELLAGPVSGNALREAA